MPDKAEFPAVQYLTYRNEFGSLLVAGISRKRAHSVTDPPVSRALSSLQWFAGYLIDNYR